MPPISLDDVIHYRPPAIESHCEPARKPNSKARFALPSSWDQAVQAPSFLPSRPPVTSPWMSKHAFDMHTFSYSSGESERSSFLGEPAQETSLGHLNDFNSGFSKASQSKDTSATISNVCSTERDPPVACNARLEQGISDRYLRDPQDTEHHESDSRFTQDAEDVTGLENLELPDASSFVPDSEELGLPQAQEGISKEIEISGLSDNPNMHTIDRRQMDPTVDLSNQSVATNEEDLSLADKEKRDTRKDSPNYTQSLASDLGTNLDEANSELPICDIWESTKAMNHNNGPVTEIQVAADHDADEVTASDQEDWYQRNDKENLLVCSKDDGDGNTARSVSFSLQCNERSRCSSPERDTRSSPVLEPPSVVILNSRSQVSEYRNSDPASSKKVSSKRRHRSEVSCEDNSDDNDDPSDSDYVHDSDDNPRGNSAIPHRTKRKRRAAAPRAAKFPRHNALRNSANDAESLDVPADQTPLTSLRDIETIPVRGFLTRQILLSKVVYSFTVEEQLEYSCVRESRNIASDSRMHVGSRPTKPHHPAISRAGTTNRPTRFLPEDDQLLIELKEDRGLPWKEIAKFFPKRSEGSLQVRYCTRLKCRHAGGLSRRKSTEKCVSRERYGPPRRRRIVDRYSPV